MYDLCAEVKSVNTQACEQTNACIGKLIADQYRHMNSNVASRYIAHYVMAHNQKLRENQHDKAAKK